MKTIHYIIVFIIALASLNTRAQSLITEKITTNKAMYSPGSTVYFTAKINNYTSNLQLVISYYHLSNLVDSKTINLHSSNACWSWKPPSQNYKGYAVILRLKKNGNLLDEASTAIDVSTDWSKFPRYGFLSDYGLVSNSYRNSVINNLNRLHINGIQFYDWLYKHHKPYPDNVSSWNDLAGRKIYKSTITSYISKAHAKNMQTMAYNLAFGALNDAENDGISDTWYMYKDQNHTTRDVHSIPVWNANIWLTQPANYYWKEYLFDNLDDMFNNMAFDGFHIDQLGTRGTTYDYWGNNVDLCNAFRDFIGSYKSQFSDKKAVMNAVSQYCTWNILQEDVEFAYTEPWPSDFSTYDDLHRIIRDNHNWSGGKSTVLAAYLNYGLSQDGGTFNDASVLRADAVIFASGGAHLQMGEHMLANEYFPNNKVLMSSNLKYQLFKYYDFLVAYENLLRDGGNFGSNVPTHSDITGWPGQTGKISCMNKTMGNYEIFHLINFTNSSNLNWRDDYGNNQGFPSVKTNLSISFNTSKSITNLWWASPDEASIAPREIEFVQVGNTVYCTLPTVTYWTMIVAESGIVSGNTYSILSKLSGKALDVEANSTANGGNIHQWTYYGNNNQKWIIDRINNDEFKITSVYSGKVLDVEGNSAENGANIHQWDYEGNSNQKWNIIDAGDGYYKIRSVRSGKILDIEAGSSADGTNIHQWTDYNLDSQKWKLNGEMSTKSASGNSVSIYNKENSDEAMYFTVQPNPASTFLNIDLGNTQPLNIKITSLKGDVLYANTHMSDSVFKIDLHEFENGLYILWIKTENQVYSKKIIVQK